MSIIEHSLVTEKTINQMDFDNKFQFVVHIDSTKSDAKSEIEPHHDVTVEKVDTQVTMKGKKKATVRLPEDDDTQGAASRIGVF